jgi:hypothetical protein
VNIQSFLQMQYRESHKLLEAAVADCKPDMLSKRHPGSTINSIGAIYGHTVFGEDGIINGLIRGAKPVYYANGWAEQIGLEMPQGGLEPDWSPAIDLAAFSQYAKDVHTTTEAWLGSASDEELAKIVNAGFAPPMPASALLGTLMLWHVGTHQGEISALKGVDGLVGLDMSGGH